MLRFAVVCDELERGRKRWRDRECAIRAHDAFRSPDGVGVLVQMIKSERHERLSMFELEERRPGYIDLRIVVGQTAGYRARFLLHYLPCHEYRIATCIIEAPSLEVA